MAVAAAVRAVLPLTRTGVLVAGTGAALIATGCWLRQPATLVVGLTGLLTLLLTGVGVARPPRVEVTRRVDDRAVTCGDPVSATVRVRNRSRLLPVAGSASERAVQLGRELRLDLTVPAMAAGASAQVDYQVPTRRRGAITLGPLEFRRSDAFGLWSRSVTAGGLDEVVVRPLVHTLEANLVGTTRTLDGVPRPAAPNGSVAFHSLREYVPGDDRRTIHWRSSARRGELMVRQLVDVTQPRLTIVLDTRSAAYPDPVDDLDAAVEVVASVLVAAAAQSISTTLHGTNTLRRQVDGTADVGAALDDLARLAGDASLGLIELGDRLEVAPGTGLLVVTGGRGGLTDEPERSGSRPHTGGSDDLNALRALAARHERCLALVIDPGAGPGARERAVSGRIQVQRCASARSALLAWTSWSPR